MCSNYIFSKELSVWIDNSGLTRKEVIILLQDRFYEEFKGLDNITLSRWFTGRTTPPLYKQLLIAQCLGVRIMDIILKINPKLINRTIKSNKIIQSIVRILDFSVSSLSYKKISDYSGCIIESQTFYEHIRDFGSFHENISALDVFFKNLYSLKGKLDYKSIKIINNDQEIIGHWSGIEDLSNLKDFSYFSFFDKNTLEKSAIINVGYFHSSKHFFDLIHHAICFYLLTNKKIDYVYLFVGSYAIYEIISDLLNIREKKYFAPKDKQSKLGVYMLKVDVVKAIANPIFIEDVQNKLKCVLSCDYSICKKCNLVDYLH